MYKSFSNPKDSSADHGDTSMTVVSMAARQAFREFCSDWLVLRTIGDAFQGHGFAANREAQPDVGGERRTYVEEFYAAIDWSSTDETRRFVHVIEDALAMARDSAQDESLLRDSLGRLDRSLARDGFMLDVDTLEIETRVGVTLTDLEPRELLNASVLHQYVAEMQQTAETRPGSAIDAAKNLIEATAKLVLDELRVPYGKSPKLPGLLAQVQEALDLHPKLVAEDAAAAGDIRRILGGLLQVGTGLGDLRNHYGDGHGRTELPRGLQPRHAHLAVGAADAYARFLLATLAQRRSPRG